MQDRRCFPFGEEGSLIDFQCSFSEIDSIMRAVRESNVELLSNCEIRLSDIYRGLSTIHPGSRENFLDVARAKGNQAVLNEIYSQLKPQLIRQITSPKLFTCTEYLSCQLIHLALLCNQPPTEIKSLLTERRIIQLLRQYQHQITSLAYPRNIAIKGLTSLQWSLISELRAMSNLNQLPAISGKSRYFTPFNLNRHPMREIHAIYLQLITLYRIAHTPSLVHQKYSKK